MKTTLTIITALAITILIVACSKQSHFTTEVVILRDITDKHLSKPNAEDISRFFNWEKGKWNEAKFRFADITDVSYNRTNETSIEGENMWLSNEYEREDKVKKFNGEIAKILSVSAKENIGKQHSSVYIPIARELSRLNKSASDKKIILIYSDLMENQKELSFYDPKKLKQLKENPEEIRKLLESQQPLGALVGIKVYIIYQPADAEADLKFRIVSEFYRNLLEMKGAKVTIGAN